MKKLLLCGLAILLVDVLLYSAQRAALLQLQCSSCATLQGAWLFSAVRWATLQLFTCRLTAGEPRAVLLKFVALLCLLSPMLESCRALLGAPSRPGLPGFSVLLQIQLASGLACLFWELCFSSGGGKMKETSSRASSSQLLWRLLKYFRADTLYIMAAFTFLLMAVVCDACIPLYQGKVIDMLKGQVDESSFCYSIGQLALVSLGSALFSGLRGGTFMCTLMRLNRRLKHQLFRSLLRQEVHFFQTTNTGSLSSRLHSDVDLMGRTMALNANAMVRSVVKTFLVLFLMLNLSWELTIMTLIEMPLTAIIQSKHISWSNEMRKQIQDCHAQNEGIALQSLELIRTVRSFKAESEEVQRYNKALEELRVIKTRKGIYSATFGIIYTFLRLAIRLLTLFQARSLISSGRLTVGTLVSFYLYQKPMSRGLTEILHSYGSTASTVRVIATVFGYLDRKPQCKTAGELAPDMLEGNVVFQNVTFTYPSMEKAALKSVSFEVQPGKLTALVGPSGSGKTSCISLLKRLYEAQEGQILLDGEPLHHYDIKYLQRKVASVSQSPELFCGSLRYNIEYGLKDCTIDEVKAAAKAANADAFISKLKDGYDTDLGDCRDKLSNGQQHSIGIVRALVRRPQIVVLDETTGKVDAEVWQAVLREVLSRGGTVLVVAHRLKTVEMAARIIFLENGEVMEEGTHTELLAKRGRYYHFSQRSGSSY